MIDFLVGASPVMQALMGTLFTWGLTSLGAAVVFLRKNPSQKLLDIIARFCCRSDDCGELLVFIGSSY